MHRATWVLQTVLAVWFVTIGVLHLALPPGLPEPMTWMHDLPTAIHWISGLAEIAGGLGLGLGLLLPSLTRIRPLLTPLAASGLAVLMLSAAVWHLGRGEARSAVTNLVLVVLLAVVATVRSRMHPIPAR